MLGADLSGHVREGYYGDQECLGRHGLGKRNNKGQVVVDFAKRMELVVTNTGLVKTPAHIVTYSSSGCSSQVDYVMVFFLFYLPYLSSIHEKANCIAILWTVSPHSLGEKTKDQGGGGYKGYCR